MNVFYRQYTNIYLNGDCKYTSRSWVHYGELPHHNLGSLHIFYGYKSAVRYIKNTCAGSLCLTTTRGCFGREYLAEVKYHKIFKIKPKDFKCLSVAETYEPEECPPSAEQIKEGLSLEEFILWCKDNNVDFTGVGI